VLSLSVSESLLLVDRTHMNAMRERVCVGCSFDVLEEVVSGLRLIGRLRRGVCVSECVCVYVCVCVYNERESVCWVFV